MKKASGLAGKGELPYRAGTYRSFLAEMVRAARLKAPLARLNVDAEDDFTNALLSAWARVCDVLTFYQERIANEGYLPTATESESVLHLAAAIGEHRKPALGAQTHLALQLIEAAGQHHSVTIDPPQSLVVQNTPAAGDLPVVFECAERIEMRTHWNALSPVTALIPVRAELWPGCRSLLVAGTSTGVRAGSALLLSVAPARSWLVIVDRVQVDRARGCTMVAWSPGIPAVKGEADWRLPVTEITLFERNAGLFGRTAMAWADVPDKTQEAIGVRAGGMLEYEPGPEESASPLLKAGLWRRRPESVQPPGDIRALLAIGGGPLLAGTSTGLYRSDDRGLEWQQLALPGGRHEILSLFRHARGDLYAGTAEGMLLASADGGDAWASLPQTILYSPAAATTAEEKEASQLTSPGRTVTVVAEAVRRMLTAQPKEKEASPEIAKWQLTSPIHAVTVVAEVGGSGKEIAARQIYIGTDQGVFAMPPDGLHWTPYNEGAFPGFNGESGTADVSVSALAVLAGTLAAATNRGLFLTSVRTATWTKLKYRMPDAATAHCLSMSRNRGALFVGLSAGAYSWPYLVGWADSNAGLGEPAPAIYSLATIDATANDPLLAATSAGIFRLDVPHSPDRPVPDWIPANTQDLTLFEADFIVARGLKPGEPGDVPISLRRRFERFGIVLDTDVAVAQLPTSTATWELSDAGGPARSPKRVFRIYEGARLRITQSVDNRIAPENLLAVADGTMLASLPLGPVLNTEWPDFANSADALLLDRKIDDLENGSRILLAPAGSSVLPDPHVCDIEASGPVLHKAFGKQATVTRIAVAPDPALPGFDPRTTNVYLASRALAPFTGSRDDLQPVAGNVLILSGSHSGLKSGRFLQVSGPRPGAVVLRGPDTSQIAKPDSTILRADAEACPALDQQMVSVALKESFTGAGIKLSLSPEVTVIARGARWLIRDGDRAWQLDLPLKPVPAADGDLSLWIFASHIYEVIGRPEPGSRKWTLAPGDDLPTIVADEDEILWQRARSVQRSVSEIATIKSVAPHFEVNTTTITLTAPLERPYDRAQCGICANVALATQGETVPYEVLGSGQLGQARQKFTLLRAPLTYTRNPDGLGIHNDLEVEVNGQSGGVRHYAGGSAPAGARGELWREAGSLALAGPSERVFSVSTDAAGRTILRFGDGIHGARLPSGNENLTASYRYGAGANGNVPAGSLIALRKRPAGIRSATNPVAATGGVDAEKTDALRARAPRKLRYCQRIVTLSDYEAFAADFPGIGKAQAALIGADDEERLIWLTAATEGGLPISQAPALREALAAAIEANRGDRLPLRLEGFAAVTFDVMLSIVAEGDVDPALVAKKVRAALAAEFGFARRDFGDEVDPHHVSETARQVPGIQSAMLLALHRSGEPQAGIAALVAEKARRDAGGAHLPAELLTINTAGATGIGIGIVVGP